VVFDILTAPDEMFKCREIELLRGQFAKKGVRIVLDAFSQKYLE